MKSSTKKNKNEYFVQSFKHPILNVTLHVGDIVSWQRTGGEVEGAGMIEMNYGQIKFLAIEEGKEAVAVVKGFEATSPADWVKVPVTKIIGHTPKAEVEKGYFK